MRKFLLSVLALLSCLAASSKGSVSGRIVREAQISRDMAGKAAEYRNAMKAPGLRNGVYVYSTSLKEYADAPEKLAARLRVLGFDDVYMSCNRTRLRDREQWTRDFIRACHSCGMRVQAMRMENLEMLVDHDRAKTEIGLIADYNAAVGPEERIDGISADIEAHIAKKKRGYTFLPYVWDAEDSFGPGKDKDRLLKLSVELFEYVRPLTDACGLELSEALSCCFQEYYNDGRVGWGSTSQYLKHCDYAIMMAYFETKETILEKSLPALRDASGEKCVSIALKTAMNSMKSASLQPKGWDYLLSTLRFVNSGASAFKSFRGIDVFNYKGLEEMWEAEN